MNKFLLALVLFLIPVSAFADSQGSATGGTAGTQSTAAGCIYQAPTLTAKQQAAESCDSTGAVLSNPGGGYVNITTNASTQVKSGPGVLHLISINTPGVSDTTTVYDNTACSGTTIGTINDASSSAETLTYDIAFSTGLCIKTSGSTAPDLTVSYR